MKCEEFETIGLDTERDGSLNEMERAAARAHANVCSRCAALQDSWQAARVKLRALAEATAEAAAPARVERRLRQEFRAQHATVKKRRVAVIAAWALAAAAVLAGVVSWNNWRKGDREESAKQPNASQNSVARSANNGGEEVNKGNRMREPSALQQQSPARNESAEMLVADSELSNFTLLPGVLPADADDTEIVRVRMQRGSLGALGLPVNEERAGEWIQVDLLVGNDGLPQAVRLRQ